MLMMHVIGVLYDLVRMTGGMILMMRSSWLSMGLSYMRDSEMPSLALCGSSARASESHDVNPLGFRAADLAQLMLMMRVLGVSYDFAG